MKWTLPPTSNLGLSMRIAAMALSFLLVSDVTYALTAIPKNFDQLVTESEIILVGTVMGTEGHRLSSGAIVTYVILGDIEVVKGDHAETTYTLQVLGGTVGDEHFAIAGAPDFEIGGTYLLFVNGNGKVMFPLVGVNHGKFHIRYDPRTETQILYNANGQVVVDIVGDEMITGSPNTLRASGESPRSLNSILQTIRHRLSH